MVLAVPNKAVQRAKNLVFPRTWSTFPTSHKPSCVKLPPRAAIIQGHGPHSMIFMELSLISGMEAARVGIVKFMPTCTPASGPCPARQKCGYWSIPKVPWVGLRCGSGMIFPAGALRGRGKAQGSRPSSYTTVTAEWQRAALQRPCPKLLSFDLKSTHASYHSTELLPQCCVWAPHLPAVHITLGVFFV